jgi:hypothetical protein
MKSKFLVRLLILVSFLGSTFNIANLSAHAEKPIPSDCDPQSEECDVNSCLDYYRELGRTAPPLTCSDGSTNNGNAATTVAAPNDNGNGPTGMPAGLNMGGMGGMGGYGGMGTNPYANGPGFGTCPGCAQGAMPGPMGQDPKDTCPLTVKDDFAAEMKKVIADIRMACPNTDSSVNIINEYVSNYKNREMNLPDGMTCENYQGRLKQDLLNAQSLGTVLTYPPDNAYAQCWVYSYNSDSGVSNYTLQDPNCFKTVEGPILESIKGSCGNLRNADYRNSSVTDALEKVTNDVSNSKNPKCLNIAPEVEGLIGQLAGTTPLGIAAVATTQILSKMTMNLFRRSAAKQDQALQNFIKQTNDKIRQGANACHYYNMVQGILGCDRYTPTPKAIPNSCSPNDFSELKETQDTIRSLSEKLNAIEGDLKATTIDLNDQKANVADKANFDLSPKYFSELKSLLDKKITSPDILTGQKVPLSEYLATLTKDKPDDSIEVGVARNQLKDLLATVNNARTAFLANKSGKLKKDFITALMRLGGDSNSVTPFDLNVLTQSEVGLKAVAAADANSASQAAIRSAHEAAQSTYDKKLEIGASLAESANKDLNVYAVDPIKADDLKTFLKSRVDDYVAATKLGDGADPKMIANMENQAIQACGSLAPFYYFEGDKTGKRLYEGATNPNFKKDFGDVCQPVFKDAKALEHLTDPPNPAPVPFKPDTNFRKNVCAAKGANARAPATEKAK